jgi:DNA-binding Xre family transcriptional regulator
MINTEPVPDPPALPTQNQQVNGSQPTVSSQRAEAIAAVIKARLREKNLSAMKLAAHINISRAAMSRAFQHPHRLIPKLKEICSFLDCSIEQLGAVANDTGEPVEHFREELWAHIFGEGHAKQEIFTVPAGCEMRLVRTEDKRFMPVWLFLAPTKKEPRDGDLVFCRLRDGKQYVRKWMPSDGAANQVVLWEAEARPVVVNLDDIETARLIIGTIKPNRVEL